jgi:pilus assembly protein CpaE
MTELALLSLDDAAATAVQQALSGSSLTHTLRALRVDGAVLEGQAPTVRSAAIIMVAASAFAAVPLPALEKLVDATGGIPCVLITPQLSPEQLMSVMRIGVRLAVPLPLDKDRLTAELASLAGKKSLESVRAGRVLTIVSPKGGAGTTLIAANLAYALAKRPGKRVLVIDLVRRFSDANLFLSDSAPSATIVDLSRQIDRLDQKLFDSSLMHISDSLHLLPGAGDPIKAADVLPEHVERLFALARPRYDAVVLDGGTTIDATTLPALDKSETIFIVLTQMFPHLYAGKRLVEILTELGYDKSKLSVIANRYDKNARIDGATLHEALGIPVAHTLPADDKAAELALNQGAPLETATKSSALAQELDKIAEGYWGADGGSRSSKGLFARLLGR